MVTRRPLDAEGGASYHVEFVEDKVALGQNLLSVLRVFPSLSFYEFSLLISSVIYHSYSTELTTAGNFLTSCKPVSFSRRTLHNGINKYSTVLTTDSASQ